MVAVDTDKQVAALSSANPWIERLPEEQRRACADELTDQAGSASEMAVAVAAWQSTAAAYADSRIRVDGSDLHYLDEPLPAPDPRNE